MVSFLQTSYHDRRNPPVFWRGDTRRQDTFENTTFLILSHLPLRGD